MEELANFECFAVPASVWSEGATASPPVVAPRARHRVWAYEPGMLGIEAIPSPSLA